MDRHLMVIVGIHFYLDHTHQLIVSPYWISVKGMLLLCKEHLLLYVPHFADKLTALAH